MNSVVKDFVNCIYLANIQMVLSGIDTKFHDFIKNAYYQNLVNKFSELPLIKKILMNHIICF